MFRQLQTPFFTVLFIFGFFYLFTKLFGPIPLTINSITTMKTELFTVSGTGEVNAAPTTASFTVGVTADAATSETAKESVTEDTNKIIAAMKGIGVPEKGIKTINYNVYPKREFSGRNDISGYTASQDLQVKVEDVELANKALDAATANGANQVSGVQFTFDDADKEKLEDQARKQAIVNAKKKAKNIADAAGVRLGRIVAVNESGGGQPPIFYDAMQAKGGSIGSEPTQLQPGENTVTITVSLSYETL